MIIIECYLLGCLIVWIWRKIFGKKETPVEQPQISEQAIRDKIRIIELESALEIARTVADSDIKRIDTKKILFKSKDAHRIVNN